MFVASLSPCSAAAKLGKAYFSAAVTAAEKLGALVLTTVILTLVSKVTWLLPCCAIGLGDERFNSTRWWTPPFNFTVYLIQRLYKSILPWTVLEVSLIWTYFLADCPVWSLGSSNYPRVYSDWIVSSGCFTRRSSEIWGKFSVLSWRHGSSPPHTFSSLMLIYLSRI